MAGTLNTPDVCECSCQGPRGETAGRLARRAGPPSKPIGGVLNRGQGAIDTKQIIDSLCSAKSPSRGHAEARTLRGCAYRRPRRCGNAWLARSSLCDSHGGTPRTACPIRASSTETRSGGIPVSRYCNVDWMAPIAP